MDVIYFDNNATTQVDERVVQAMLPYFTTHYGNASSRLHPFGWQAKAAVEKAQEQVAQLLNAEPSEIVFTSGATEAVNLAIKGVAEAYKSKGNHIITLKTEHPAVLDTYYYLAKQGYEVTLLDVDREGILDISNLEAAIRPDTILVSVMMANNETGVLQDIERIGSLCKQREVLFFTDATQQAGKLQIDVQECCIDLLALSAHKFYGPKGIGALYVRRKSPRVSILPQLHGGGHQQNKRSGTLPVPLIAGLGEACQLATEEMWDNSVHISKLKNFFEHQLLDIDGLRINGSTRHRLFNVSNITFPEHLIIAKLNTRFAFSSGSACAGEKQEPSHVLKAMQISDEDIRRSFRFSFGKYNTLSEIASLLETIQKIV
ncbi:MAG: cysteine desulfurase family protein [Sediminibacterium sp.]|nr:cysteine desulfurase family protein [Sediminibacterium sp.]